MDLKIELLDVFLDEGIEALFKEERFTSKVRNSKIMSREQRLLQTIGCDLTLQEYFGYLTSVNCPITEFEESISTIKSVEPGLFVIDPKVAYARKLMTFLPTMIGVDFRQEMVDFMRANPNYKELSDNQIKAIINQHQRETPTDPIQLLFERDTAKFGNKERLGKSALQIFQGIIEDQGEIDEVSNILASLNKTQKTTHEILLKEPVTMKDFLNASFLYTEQLYVEEFNWLHSQITTNVWSIYMLPFLPQDRRKASTYLIPWLDMLARRSKTSPRKILDEITSSPKPIDMGDFTIFGTIMRDTVFVKDGEMAVIDETIVQEINLHNLEFRGKEITENGNPLKDIYFKQADIQDNYLIKRSM